MLYSFVIPQNHRRRVLRDTDRRYVIRRGSDASRTPYGVGRYKMQKRKLRQEGAAFDIPTWTDWPMKCLPVRQGACNPESIGA